MFTRKEMIIPYRGKLERCSLCGSYAIIYGWTDGIGDIGCSNPDCENSCGKQNLYHYSGKFHRRKRDMIKRWNAMNQIEPQMKMEYKAKEDS